MPIDARIALGLQPVQIAPPDFAQTAGTLAALRNAQAQGELRDLQVAGLRREQAEGAALAPVIARHLGGGGTLQQLSQAAQVAPAVPGQSYATPRTDSEQLTPDTQAPPGEMAYMRAPESLQRPAAQGAPNGPRQPTDWRAMTAEALRVAPTIGLARLEFLQKLEGLDQTRQTAALTQEKTKMELQLKGLEVFGDLIGSISDQTSLDETREMMRVMGAPPAAIARLPRTYDPAAVARLQQIGVSQKDRMELQIKQMEARQRGATSAETQRHNLAMEAGVQRGNDVTTAGQRQTAETARQGMVNKPMEKVVEKNLEALDAQALGAVAVHRILDEADQLVQQGIYEAGLVNNPAIALYKSQRITTVGYDQEKLARTARLAELGASMALDQQGGKVASQTSNTEQAMIQQASGNLSAPPTLASLRESMSSVRRLANDKIQQRNTAFRQYPVPSPLPEPQQAGPAESRTASHDAQRLTEADIATTIQASGKTRAQIIAAAKAQDWRTP